MTFFCVLNIDYYQPTTLHFYPQGTLTGSKPSKQITVLYIYNSNIDFHSFDLVQLSFLCVQLAKCKRIILLDDNQLIKMRLVSINTSVFKLNHSYGAQTLHNSDVFFVCQLLFWLSAGSMVVEGGGRSGWQLQPGCQYSVYNHILSFGCCS